MSKEELKPIDVSKYTVKESGNDIKSEEKETTKGVIMTEKLKRKLRKDARQWWFQTTNISLDNLVEELLVFLIEPREKQIQIDAEQIRALQKQNGELTDKVKELKAQIEKMKCCGNCSHFKLDSSGLYPINVCELTYPNRCKNHDKWEIKEK